MPNSLGQRNPRVHDKRHLGAVARLPSLISGREPVEVAHVRYGDARIGKPQTGMQEKPHDKWVVPLTPDEHRLGSKSQHAGNERKWWESHGIDPLSVCQKLYACWETGKSEAEVIEMMRGIVLRARTFGR